MGLVSVSPGANGFGLSEGILLPEPRGGWGDSDFGVV